MKKIIILSPRITEDSELISKAAFWQGWDSIRTGQDWKIPENIAHRKKGLYVYGEPLFGLYIAEQLGKTLHLPDENWLVSLHDDFLKRLIHICTVKEVKEQISEQRFFVKPVHQKRFEAKIYDNPEDLENIDDNELAIVSDIIEFQYEVRHFILNNTVMTSSQYHTRLEDRVYMTDKDWQGARNFIGEFLKRKFYTPAKSVVVDIGYNHEKGWMIIEANESYCSGVYDCDTTGVLQTLEGQWKTKK